MNADLADVSRDLDSMVKRASEGEEIVILVNGQPMARLVGALVPDKSRVDRATWAAELETNANAAICSKAVATPQAFWDASRADRF
ncbi:hypothetical protein LF1_05520 [Rubripirellula obstinata]|uniref:Antitoxin n=1 Tax=Rubripirellula obstinata TaxID=406547 RepID=A0A5B1CA88_9BACT|nr:hypothetical protein [Rubripirellula obstinata]KAA1258037.1 hypothetical protein LF1_05520 [Rubripirellula obstinata]